ncbi:CAAX protease [Microcoleus sp. FACHB-1515]|uniref:CAAX protease n=1 Tax=Cyanophyceae TaxID=3028117 RepID=UPI001685F8DD|nr:CAAX protease [Microcoleus sp. FACHB-1515]MBD2089830.1 CAAX protease [Microcoleus sp. FACHB-1515]
MADSAVNQLGDRIGDLFSLNQEAFQTIISLPQGRSIALLVVLLAGLSVAIGQSIILFSNRVQPVRFVFSLLLNAVLFVFGFLFLVLSTWLISWLPGLVHLSWRDLVRVLGLSYAPLLFSFLGAMPYLGVPILNLLSVWHLLAMVTGISAIAQIGGASAFVQVAVGWLMLNLLEGTIGAPIAQLGQRLTRRVAGVDLVRQRSELAKQVEADFGRHLSSVGADRSPPAEIASTATAPTRSRTAQPASAALQKPVQEADTIEVRLEHWFQRIPQIIRLGLILLGMLLVFGLVALLLRPIRLSLFGWYENLPRLVRWIFDLSWIGVVSLIFAGLLAPLETLGWWAGWYGEEVDTHSGMATVRSNGECDRASRYVIYLDGVGQSGEAYTPDVVDFLEALQPALPEEMPLVQGLMMYSVRNQPLVADRPLAWVWRLADKMRWENPMALLGLAVNIRNAWVVAISTDKRYGPIYNRGIAQTLYHSLIERGYQPKAGTPVTLIGYSGGGQMAVAAAPYLKRALGTTVEVISLGGVMSANNPFLTLEHLYHLVGDKDVVAALGPILFPGRRKWFPLSYWNRARRKGKISEISLGAMGHQVPGGIMDPNAVLPNGETHLQHTIATILSILHGQFLLTTPPRPRQTSNYEVYQQADFNHYTDYPIDQTVDARWYRPIAPWMGRLILPQHSERRLVRGVWFEVHHAAKGYEFLVGQRVMLRWAIDPIVKQRVRAVTRDVHFSVDAQYSSQYGGTIHPDRLNHWQQVDPLESLAGAHPTDDVIVMLEGAVKVGDQQTALYIHHQPIEITGRYYGLVQFEAPIAGTDCFRVRHFNSSSRQFDGEVESVRLPEVVMSPGYGSQPSTAHQIEQSPLNAAGWYIYGAKDQTGCFVVQAIAPRSLFRLQPDRVVFGSKASYRYIRKESWANIVAQKGKISSVLCVGQRHEQIQAAIDEWQVGDRALLLHVYGGIGGNKKEPAAATPLFFGHFSFGIATVIHDPISDERRFDISYYQVYAHNTDGITSGTLHWSRYMGDRQFGWLGTRPVCDILIKFEPFTGNFDLNGTQRSPLTTMVNQLEAMTARYRIGDGTGATYVGPANNCVQDSNQALFASIRSISEAIENNQPLLQSWLTSNPDQAHRYQQLLAVKNKLNDQLQPFGSPRADWEANEFNLGTTMEDDPLRNLWTGLGSWRTLLPRKASDTIVEVFLKHGASVWVLRTNQVGGHDPDIEPIAPMTL